MTQEQGSEEAEVVPEGIRVEETPGELEQEVPQGEKPPCVVELRPMAEWVGEPDEDFCRPCIMPMPINWYHQELQDKGFPELSNELEQAQQSQDPVKVAQVMDSIKERVPYNLRYRLMEFDCTTQAFQEEDQRLGGEQGSG